MILVLVLWMNMIGSMYQAENITTGPSVSVLNNV